MTGIGIPPIHPEAYAGGGSFWPGVVAAAVLLVIFAAAIWTYVRARPIAPRRREEGYHFPKAA